MAKNKMSEGIALVFTNGTGSLIPSGAPVVVNSMVCVAAGDIADGANGTLYPVGVFWLPKTAGAAIDQGTKPLFDISAGAFKQEGATAAAGDISGAVVAWEDAESAATTVAVKLLNPGVVEAG